jgi:hypothetical protein
MHGETMKKKIMKVVCSFALLALQPIVVVFLQPGSGL